MSYEVFKDKVLAFVRPLGLKAQFKHDNGRHYANISDGTVIVGNKRSEMNGPLLICRREDDAG